MRFSVLVPVYNVEEYLKECIESVLKQDFKDYELILVDDGSTDKSGEICDEYCRMYPNVIRVIHKMNEGLLLARRTGIQLAKGQFFVFLDSDDYLYPGALSTISETITNYDCDMVLYNYYKEQVSSVIHLIPEEDVKVFSGVEKKYIYQKLLNGAYLNAMWTRAVKRNIVDIDEDYSVYGRISMGEDLVQGLPLYTNASKIVYIDKCLVFYRKNKNGMTAQWKANYIYSFQVCQRVMRRYIEKWDIGMEIQSEYFCLVVKRICDYLEYAFMENKNDKGKFHEICNVVFDDKGLMETVKRYGRKCKQFKHRVYSKIIYRKLEHLLFLFTGMVVRVISVKTQLKEKD